jgi:ABC-type transporter Mla subunit MlaD
MVQGDDMKRLLAGSAKAADRLARAVAQLPPLIAALQATAQRTDSGIGDLERALVPLMRDMQAAAQNLREITEALRRAPAQLLLGSPPPRSPEEQGR